MIANGDLDCRGSCGEDDTIGYGRTALLGDSLGSKHELKRDLVLSSQKLKSQASRNTVEVNHGDWSRW